MVVNLLTKIDYKLHTILMLFYWGSVLRCIMIIQSNPLTLCTLSTDPFTIYHYGTKFSTYLIMLKVMEDGGTMVAG